MQDQEWDLDDPCGSSPTQDVLWLKGEGISQHIHPFQTTANHTHEYHQQEQLLSLASTVGEGSALPWHQMQPHGHG